MINAISDAISGIVASAIELKETNAVLEVLLYVLLAAAGVWITARAFLRAPDHSKFDEPVDSLVGRREIPSPEIAEVHRWLGEMDAKLRGVRHVERLAELRRIMDGSRHQQ